MSPLGRIHLIADLGVLDTVPDADARIAALLAAGLPSLSVRAPGRAVDGWIGRARIWRRLARDHGAFFVVNGPEEAFRELAADGWHRPAATDPPGPEFSAPWGRSAHNATELANATGASWVFLSPAFPTPSKPDATPLDPEELAALAKSTSIPALALGGVTRQNADRCLAAGVDGVAAIRGLLAADGVDWVRDMLREGLRPAAVDD